MTVEYCTLIDAAFVPRWLALHRSMSRHGDAVRFRVCCMDAKSAEIIDRLALPGVVTMALEELEAADPDLAAVRAERWFRAYRSTAKPCLCRHLFDRDPAVDVVVYLDADLMFFADPAALLEELGTASVLLVPQRHRPEQSQFDETFGLYQAGSVAFRRGSEASAALDWWRARCLEWCSLQPEPGRFADQRYLQDWPERFDGVRVTQDPGIGLAPWNAARDWLSRNGDRPVVKERPLTFYHYSGLTLASGSPAALRLLGRTPGNRFRSGPVPLVWAQTHHPAGPGEAELVWDPYVREVSAALASVRELAPGFRGGLVSPWAQFAEVVLRKRLLWTVMWRLRTRLERPSRARLLRLVDGLRARWRVE